MNRNSKKGFTIVELIIVIAVIAVLAAVLIPTFSNLIQKANVAADQTLIKNLNTALAMDTTVSKHETMTQALEATKANGFDVEKIVARATDNKIVWDSANDCFAYIEKGKSEPTYIPDTKTNPNVADYQLWTIVDNTTLDAKYSSYIAGTSVSGAVEATKGVDVGENTGITAVTYTNNGGEQKVVIRTNGGTLEVNANEDTVKHYGDALSVDVKAIANNSYHVYGKVGFIQVATGRVVVESTAKVVTVYASENTAKIDNNNGSIENAYAAAGVTNAGNAELSALPEDKTVEEVKIEAETKSIAVAKVGDNYYSTLDTAFTAALAQKSVVIDIVDDIDLSGKIWNPITIESGKTVVVNGNGHVITNLYVDGFTRASDGSMVFPSGSAATYNCAFVASNKGTLTINNLTFDKAYSDMDTSKDTSKTSGSSQIAVVVAATSGTLTLNEVNVSNSVIKGYTKVGVLVGHASSGSIVVDHCTLTNNTVVLEADGTDPDGALSAVIIGYSDPMKNNQNTSNCNITINGIKLNGNKNTIDSSIKWTGYERKTTKGTIYVMYSGYYYYLTCDTFVRGNDPANTVEFVTGADGYMYEK